MNRFAGRKHFLFPVVLFLSFFALDKTCHLSALKMLSQPDATYLYYDYKSTLLEELETVYRANEKKPAGEKKRILVVLGSSRLMYFDYPAFERNFPDWEMFNFSSPVTSPAYYSYMVEKFLERGIKPDYLLVETDSFQFNESSAAFLKSNVTYSFDLPFILKNARLFKTSEISYWLGQNLFASLKYSPDPQRIIARLRDDQQKFQTIFRELDKYQRENRGAGRNVIPKQDYFERDFGRLEGTSRMTIGWIYGNYKTSDRQYTFLEHTLERAEKAGIFLALIRPPVSRPMERILAQEMPDVLAEYDRRIADIRSRHPVPFLDLLHRDDYYCNTFVDGSHMAIDCYYPMMLLMMREYRKARLAKGVM